VSRLDKVDSVSEVSCVLFQFGLGCTYSVVQFVCCLGKGVDSVCRLTITEVCKCD